MESCAPMRCFVLSLSLLFNVPFAVIPKLVPQIYLGTLTIISLYGLHKLLLIRRFYKNRFRALEPRFQFQEADLPNVTVQLPIFNEMYVAERLIDAVAQLDYPTEKLEIQVLDDSNDETQRLCQQKVRQLHRQNLNIHYLHRDNRQGFKAGALEFGLQKAQGELVLIFDADFVPKPNTLREMVHYFSDPTVGMVQARWSHLNRKYSLLTEIQALMLDGHFVIEQTARHRSGCFFNFNGTAGIWRVRAIDQAGGWQHSTVTEDLDLSYRVQLKGWKCIYLPHIAVPAELPMEMNAFKSQQFRWAKGASQVTKKLLLSILKSRQPLHVKLEASLHLTNNLNYLFLLVVLILSLPYQIYIDQNQVNYNLLIYVPIFLGTTLNLLSFYLIAQREKHIWDTSQLQDSPLQFGCNILGLMGIGIGLSINQSLAVCEGFMRAGTDFIRTPKHGVIDRAENWSRKKYRGNRTLWILGLEMIMLCYLLITVGFAIHFEHYLSLPFLLLFTSGYAYVLGLAVFQNR